MIKVVTTGGLRVGAALVALGAAASAQVGFAAATSTAHGAPVLRAAPAHAPAASEHNGTCVVSKRDDSASPPQSPDDPLVWLRAEPSSVVAIWLPGLNAKKCVARRTVSGATLAARIAAAVRHAGAFPNGALPCPYDDGTAVQLYLRYPDRPDEYALVTLSGCRAVGAPARHSRWSTARLQHALSKAAPKAWARYFAS